MGASHSIWESETCHCHHRCIFWWPPVTVECPRTVAQSKAPLPKQAYLESLQRLQRFAIATDSCFRIPLTRVRFGLSPVLGLLPIIGDFAGLVLSFYVINEARRMQAPKGLQRRMVFNAVVEAVLGIVPFVGDAFDVWFKANTRNLALLTRYLEVQLEPPRQRSGSRLWLWLILLALLPLVWWLVMAQLAP
ncbi:MAG: DUF4112 domain-containing protein [Halomonadaceae bacterium]|nr:MAG: DUF4112 domain-containing protein [Halomonadaceae bacterium]